MSIYTIADTHFNHANIIKYCSRPFNDVHHMNEALIANWNRVIGKDDAVIHVGDFGFGSTSDLKKIVKRLNGQLYIVWGNHDKKSRMQEVLPRGRILGNSYPNYDSNGDYTLFTHKPPGALQPMYNAETTVQIYGHLHNKPHALPQNGVCVSVELINYTPISLEAARKRALNGG